MSWISTTILLLNAGHEATVHQIGNTVHAILAHELDPEQLFSDADTTSRTIEESLARCENSFRFDTS